MKIAIVCNGQLGSAIRSVLLRQKNRFHIGLDITWFDDSQVGQTLSQGALPFANYTPQEIAENHDYIVTNSEFPTTHAIANALPDQNCLITVNRTDMFHGTGKNIVDGVGVFSGLMDMMSAVMMSEFSTVDRLDYYVGMNPNMWDGKTAIAPNIDPQLYKDIVNSGKDHFSEVSLRSRNYVSEAISHALYLPYHPHDYSLNWLYLSKGYRDIVRSAKKLYNHQDSYLDIFCNINGKKFGQSQCDIYYTRVPATQGASAWHYAEACCVGSWIWQLATHQIEKKEWHPKDADWKLFTDNIFGKRFQAAPIAA
ncbi:MAG: hypothetical protein CMA64_10025 [Euryarchaeota archaeon]|jgi:hypothetical protein|nr:hypothetical protein [Euryarchaeota archaeon]